MRFATTLLAILPLVLVTASAGATPVPILRVAELARASTIVVIGYINRIDDTGPGVVHTANGDIPSRSYQTVVHVDHVIKGGDLSSIVVTFVTPDAQTGYEHPSVDGQYRMFFLRGDAEPYAFTSPFHASVTAVAGLTLHSAQPDDRMFEALGRIATDGQVPLAIREEAIHNLSDTKNHQAIAALRTAFGDQESTIRTAAAMGLVASGDASALTFAVDALSGRTPGVSSETLVGLASAVGRGASDPAAVPALVRLLAEGDDDGRRAAAEALRQLKAATAVHGLLAAMNDKDRIVRHTVVTALAEISGELNWLPSLDYFWSNEALFIEHWRRWAEQLPQGKEPD